MNSLLSITNKAKTRLIAQDVMSTVTKWCIALAVVTLLIAVADRLGASPFLNWQLYLTGLGLACVLITVTTWALDKRTNVEVATEVDQKFGLRDRISSALACEETKNPFAATVIQDAHQVSEEANVQSKIPSAFPIKFPIESSWILFIGIAVGAVFISPQWNLFGNQTPSFQNPVIMTTESQVEESIDAVIDQISEETELSTSLEKELADLAELSSIDSDDPEAMRHEALRQMTDLQKQLDEMLQSEDALAFAEMSRRLKELQLPTDSETLPLIVALKKGDFGQAKKEFERLEERLNSETISEEERKNLEDALKQLAEQLQELSAANEALASALSAAGLDSALADNPEAAQKAIANATNLNDEQKKQLLEMLKTQQSASKKCENMAKECQNACQGSDKSKMAGELEQLEAIKNFCTKAQLAKRACQNAGNKMCNNPGLTGARGKGNGGANRVAETETSTVAERSPVKTGEGSIIARQLFHGGLLTTGDSESQVRETVLAERESAERAIADEQVPKRYHELLRHYFGQLEKLTESTDTDSDETSQ